MTTFMPTRVCCRPIKNTINQPERHGPNRWPKCDRTSSTYNHHTEPYCCVAYRNRIRFLHQVPNVVWINIGTEPLWIGRSILDRQTPRIDGKLIISVHKKSVATRSGVVNMGSKQRFAAILINDCLVQDLKLRNEAKGRGH